MKYTFNFTPVSEGLPEYGRPVLLMDETGQIEKNVYETWNKANCFEPAKAGQIIHFEDVQAWAYIDEAEVG
jgi:SpoVK/Ycf46/Vps4 family AAA+-type ATPase